MTNQPLWKSMSPEAQAAYRKMRQFNNDQIEAVKTKLMAASPSKCDYWTRAMSAELGK